MASSQSNSSQEAVSFDQLEPCKENIQPLLRSAGKRMRSLAKNLQQTPKALTEKQERERSQWEYALKHDTSNDPLNLWLKYIKWIKLNFTSTTNQKAQLLPLIERCTTALKDDKRYTNNKHYIKLWLEYAHLSRDPMEIFKFLYANNIGSSVALLWRGWAIVAEQQHKFDLVDRIFNAAKQMNAEPIKDINKSYDQFLFRMKKKISNQNMIVINQLQSNNMRSTLAQITHNSNSHRNDHIKARGFGEEIDTKNDNRNTGKFGIYCDDFDNGNMIDLPPVTSGWRDLGTAINRSKENDAIPTTWNNEEFYTHKYRVPIDNTFAVPIDDEEIISTHCRAAMGQWKQQGRYLCAAFYDPNLLIYDGAESSLEEARYRRMKTIWNKEWKQENAEDDDMMMTMNVGRILYHKTDLSIPSTIKEEPIRNRKRKSLENQEIEPHKKRFKFGDISSDHTYDVFAELTTMNNTIGSHYETPLRKLDFTTPSHTLMSKNTSIDAIESMTEFFKNPIKITDKRMDDTPTVTNTKPRIFNPTQTVTFHSKAAMNDIVKIFGGCDDNADFGIYQDTATIHTQIDINSISIQDIGLQLPLVIDPLDETIMIQHEAMLLHKYKNMSNVYDCREKDIPITIQSLLNGETDIELDDDDGYLNVTEYIKRMSKDKHYIFVVNDLSEEEDTERMLLIDSPSSLRSYNISSILKSMINTDNMEYAFVESIYLYNNASLTLSKISDNFFTLNDIIIKCSDLDDKLLLYFLTQIMRIIGELHCNNIIHSNLALNSFLIKLSECNSISSVWCDAIPPVDGWQNFGLLLHDINHCISLDEFIDIEGASFGCLIDDKNKNTSSISCIFQELINNKTWCYEVDVFSIFIIMIQLLTHRNDDAIIKEINYNENIVKQIDLLRNSKGLSNLSNKNMWHKILNMLLMKEDDANMYSFDKRDMKHRKNYLKQCYKHCAVQLMDLENLSPKLQIILARLDRMIQT